jgi:hypothetical protein
MAQGSVSAHCLADAAAPLPLDWRRFSENWLATNCSGFYYMPNDSHVLFEKEEDAVLFKTAYEGK